MRTGDGADVVEKKSQSPSEPSGRNRRQVVAHQHGRRGYILRRLLATADVAAYLFALYLAARQAPEPAETVGIVFWGAFALPCWLLVLKAYRLYDHDLKRIHHTTMEDLPGVFHATLLSGFGLWGYFSLLPTAQLNSEQVVLFAVVVLLSVVVLRSAVRQVARRMLGPERVVFIGESDVTTDLLLRKISDHPEYHLQPVGRLTAQSVDVPETSGLPYLGTLEELPSVAFSHAIERVIVAHAGVFEETLLDVLRQCKQLSLKVTILPQMFDVMGPSVEIDDVEGITVLGINPPVLSRSSRLLKRSMDLVGAGLLVVLLSPVMLAVAVAVLIDSGRPVFFRQERVGQGGRRFKLLKFRTMVRDAETLREYLIAQSRDPDWLDLDIDPRITGVGRFLRNASLDELPQLLNVLRGEMSLVGPRPLVEVEDQRIHGWGRSRLDLMPGITGLWQVLGRTNIPFHEMVKLDYLYVTNWSLWSDIRLMVQTLPAVIHRRGVN